MVFPKWLDKNQFQYTDRTDNAEFSVKSGGNPFDPRNPCAKEPETRTLRKPCFGRCMSISIERLCAILFHKEQVKYVNYYL